MINHSKIISIKTTAACQLRCENCFVVPWMEKNKGWQWSMSSVLNFIEATKQSNYHFNIILLSGGEPLLWDNLIPALRAIRAAKITNQIKMLTNSIKVTEANLDWFETVVRYVDLIRISRYIGNEKSIELIQKSFRANPKIHISDKTEFCVQAKEPVVGALPADCACDYPTVFGNSIHACGGMQFLSMFHKIPITRSLITPIQPGYLSEIESSRALKTKLNQKVCAYCMVNRKVLSGLKKEKNYCLKGKENEISIG